MDQRSARSGEKETRELHREEKMLAKRLIDGGGMLGEKGGDAGHVIFLSLG